jgi:hypothetical protein
MGHMLGSSCSACCSPQGTCPCLDGQLPNTVTVAFAGQEGQKEQGPPLLELRFSSCFGSGATGFAMAPGGVDTKQEAYNVGPISSVQLTNAGMGYAILGRVPPTLSVTGVGQGAVFTPTLEMVDSECGVPTWKIASVSVAGGSGYVDNEVLTVATAAGDTIAENASLSLSTKRAAPSVTASVSGGIGAELLVTTTTSNSQEWGVAAVSVVQGGSGYTDFSPVTFAAAPGDDVAASATAIARTNRQEPVVSAAVQGTGEGAALQVTLTKYGFEDSWYVSGITVIDGGSGYTDGDPVIATTDDQELWGMFAEAIVTNGEITGVTIYDGGAYYREGGVIQSIEIFYGGEYYRQVPESVTVNNGGKYFRSDPQAQAYVSLVEVSVLQGFPGGDGSGAVITAVVDSEPSSSAFGRIASLQILSGGDGYLGWVWRHDCSCQWRYAGNDIVPTHTVVAWRDLRWWGGGDPCRYVAPRCYNSFDSTGGDALVRAVVSSHLRPDVAVRVTGPVGWPDRDSGPLVSVTSANGTTGVPLSGYAIPGRVQDQPNIVRNNLTGAEAPITATVSQEFESVIAPYWVVTAVEVPPSTTGFFNTQIVQLRSTTQQPLLRGSETREFATGRAVVDANGFLVAVVVLTGGKFYNESASVPAISNATVSIQQHLPSQGQNAQITAQVNTDLNSVNFGRATLSITNAGTGYLGGWSGSNRVTVVYPGFNAVPTVTATRGACLTTLFAEEPIGDCGDFSFSATFLEQSALVSPGGNVQSIFEGSTKCCGRCFMCCPESPLQIVATFTRAANSGAALRAEDNPKPDGLDDLINASITFQQGVVAALEAENPVRQDELDRARAELACAQQSLQDDGYLRPRFPNIYGGITFSGDKYSLTCDAHDVELVIDVESLLAEEGPCGGIDVRARLPQGTSPSAGSVLDQDDLVSECGSGPLTDPPGIGEVTELFATIFVIGANFVADDRAPGTSCPILTVSKNTLWRTGPLLGFNIPWQSVYTSTANKIVTYNKPPQIKCGKVSDWDKQTSRQFSTTTGNYIGAPSGEPEDKYERIIGEFDLFGTGANDPKYFGVARRICNNYDVSVEFQ